jgi:hypothetical protein
MSRRMTIDELKILLEYISANNSVHNKINPKCPLIKYVIPHFDIITNMIFSITLRSYGNSEYNFHTANEFRNNKESLFDRIIIFLKTEII